LLLESLKSALELFASFTEHTIGRGKKPVPTTAWTYCESKVHMRSLTSTVPVSVCHSCPPNRVHLRPGDRLLARPAVRCISL
jgi:hypothetical protein